MQIFLDLDGVVRDWNTGIEELYDVDFKMNSWDDWKMLCTDLGISHSNFWNSQTDDWWAEVPMYAHAQRLLQGLAKYKPVICTSPTNTSAGGTQKWIRKHMPEYFATNRYIITRSKKFVAGPDKILIDDNDTHCEEWRDAGGKAILFPQPWNKSRGLTSDKVDHVLRLLETHYRISTHLKKYNSEMVMTEQNVDAPGWI